MTFWFQMSYYQVFVIRKWPLFFMKIHHYGRAFLLEKCAHNVTQYGDKNIYSPMMMSSQHHILQTNNKFLKKK